LVLADERRALIPPPEDSGNPRTGRHRRVPEPPAAEPPASKPPASEPPADGRGVVPPASEPAVSEPPAAPQLTAAASLA
jgi:hypothetical protein